MFMKAFYILKICLGAFPALNLLLIHGSFHEAFLKLTKINLMFSLEFLIVKSFN